MSLEVGTSPVSCVEHSTTQLSAGLLLGGLLNDDICESSLGSVMATDRPRHGNDAWPARELVVRRIRRGKLFVASDRLRVVHTDRMKDRVPLSLAIIDWSRVIT